MLRVCEISEHEVCKVHKVHKVHKVCKACLSADRFIKKVSCEFLTDD